MAIPGKPLRAEIAGLAPGPFGNLPGTEHLGILFTEYVDIERSVGGTWTRIAAGVPAAFEPVRLHTRVDLEPWTHKPLLGLWLMPDTPLEDGDRVVREDGSRWYVRGAPLAAPARTHIAALVEAETEDGLFAAPG
jgi:hypothetical protein